MKDDISNSATAVKDPVCGMNVNPATAKHHLEHAGKSVYFCCAPCAEKFKANPEKYLTEAPRPPSSSLVALQTRLLVLLQRLQSRTPDLKLKQPMVARCVLKSKPGSPDLVPVVAWR